LNSSNLQITLVITTIHIVNIRERNSLIPGWKTLDGKRDIGWAEAVGFEFLVSTIISAASGSAFQSFKLYGDNTGVVEGWWSGRNRNGEINSVFKRIHNKLETSNFTDRIFTAYVPSARNPADDPSRGIYSSQSLLLPPVQIPTSIS